MKKFFLSFAALAIVALVALGVSSYAPAPAGIAAPSGSFVNGGFPVFYTNVDTVGASATDSLWCHIKNGYSTNLSTNNLNSITYTIDAWSVAGATTTNFTVALYGSGNGGYTYGTTPITTFTVTPAGVFSATGWNKGAVATTYIVNAGAGGNPYTDYLWVASNTAASTRSWKGSVTLR